MTGTRPQRAERLCVRLSAETRAILEEIKQETGLASDAEVIRMALGLQRHIARRQAQGYRVYLGDETGKIARELLIGGGA